MARFAGRIVTAPGVPGRISSAAPARKAGKPDSNDYAIGQNRHHLLACEVAGSRALTRMTEPAEGAAGALGVLGRPARPPGDGGCSETSIPCEASTDLACAQGLSNRFARTVRHASRTAPGVRRNASAIAVVSQSRIASWHKAIASTRASLSAWVRDLAIIRCGVEPNRIAATPTISVIVSRAIISRDPIGH